MTACAGCLQVPPRFVSSWNFLRTTWGMLYRTVRIARTSTSLELTTHALLARTDEVIE
jgi:hypothetical protein